MDVPANQMRLARERLAVLEAIVRAQGRHVEVAAALWAAADRRAAIATVAELLGVEPAPAHAVVELPWWRLGMSSRRQAEDDRDEVLSWLRDAEGPEAG